MTSQEIRWAALDLACWYFEGNSAHIPDHLSEPTMAMVWFGRFLSEDSAEEFELRRKALVSAIRTTRGNPIDVVTRAERYLRFLKTGRGPRLPRDYDNEAVTQDGYVVA